MFDRQTLFVWIQQLSKRNNVIANSTYQLIDERVDHRQRLSPIHIDGLAPHSQISGGEVPTGDRRFPLTVEFNEDKTSVQFSIVGLLVHNDVFYPFDVRSQHVSHLFQALGFGNITDEQTAVIHRHVYR